MPRKRWVLTVTCMAVLALPSISAARIVTYGGGATRTGLDTSMRQLTPSALAAHEVGRLFNAVLPDHAQVYGQPLLADGRLIVATESNDVYELDPRSGKILASRSLGPAWTPIVPAGTNPLAPSFLCKDLDSTVGVTSTPVVDTSADGGRGVIYVTSDQPATAAGPTLAGQSQYLMFALDLRTLANVASFNGGQPLALTGSIAGTDPLVAFDPTFQLQQAALLETGGRVFAGFGSDCGISPYRGWILDVQASTGRLLGSWADETAPGARGAAIWMAGGGLMSDGPGRVFFATGTAFAAPGYTSASAKLMPGAPTAGDAPPPGLAESVVQLRVSTTGALATADFFAPCDAAALSAGGDDIASGGVVALPPSFGTRSDRDPLLAGGEGGKLYLLNRGALGGFEEGVKTQACPGGGDKVLGEYGSSGSIWTGSAVWPYNGGWVFVDTQTNTTPKSGASGAVDVYAGGVGRFHLAGQTPLISGTGSSGAVITSVGSSGTTALAWIVTRSPSSGDGTLRAYDVVMGPGASGPKQVASFPVGSYTEYVPPGLGSDTVYVAGAGHIEAFGLRTK
jgi:hypothetical protein